MRQIPQLCCAAFIALSVAASAVNAEIAIKPTVSTQAYYDNNPRLRTDPATEVAATINEVALEANYTQQTYGVLLAPRFRLSRYTEETELDAEDYFLRLEGFKSLERSQLAGNFRYEREASFTTEQTDSDRFNVNVPRTTLAMDSSWEYSLSEKSRIALFGNVLDVSFDDPPPFTLIDYVQFGAGTSFSHAVSDRTVLVASLSASQFKTPQLGSKTLSYSYQFGIEHSFDESLSASFRIGNNIAYLDFKTTETELISLTPPVIVARRVNGNSRASGEIISMSANKYFDRAELRFNWDRTFSPSSEGSRRRSQRVSGFGRYRISRALDGTLDVIYRESQQERTQTLQGTDEREILLIRGAVRYAISKFWRAELGLQYREINRLETNSKSDSQRLFLALRYTPDQINFR